MRNVYPVLFKKSNEDYLAYIPDIDRMTEASSMYDGILMARDLLGTYSLDNDLKNPSSEKDARKIAKEKADTSDCEFSNAILQFVDIDTDEYKRKLNTKAVKKNCTIPSWLNDKAEAEGINFSKMLQDALLKYFNLQ